MPIHSPLLKKTRVRQVVLDKWLPLTEERGIAYGATVRGGISYRGPPQRFRTRGRAVDEPSARHAAEPESVFGTWDDSNTISMRLKRSNYRPPDSYFRPDKSIYDVSNHLYDPPPSSLGERFSGPRSPTDVSTRLRAPSAAALSACREREGACLIRLSLIT